MNGPCGRSDAIPIVFKTLPEAPQHTTTTASHEMLPRLCNFSISVPFNQGWDEGVPKMSLGEKAILRCTSDYAYGREGAGGVIPPNAGGFSYGLRSITFGRIGETLFREPFRGPFPTLHRQGYSDIYSSSSRLEPFSRLFDRAGSLKYTGASLEFPTGTIRIFAETAMGGAYPTPLFCSRCRQSRRP